MKFEYFETRHGLEIKLIPESPEEVAKLARYTRNAKMTPPDVCLDFNTDKPEMRVWLKKYAEKAQKNYLTNKFNY